MFVFFDTVKGENAEPGLKGDNAEPGDGADPGVLAAGPGDGADPGVPGDGAGAKKLLCVLCNRTRTSNMTSPIITLS